MQGKSLPAASAMEALVVCAWDTGGITGKTGGGGFAAFNSLSKRYETTPGLEFCVVSREESGAVKRAAGRDSVVPRVLAEASRLLDSIGGEKAPIYILKMDPEKSSAVRVWGGHCSSLECILNQIFPVEDSDSDSE